MGLNSLPKPSVNKSRSVECSLLTVFPPLELTLVKLCMVKGSVLFKLSDSREVWKSYGAM